MATLPRLESGQAVQAALRVRLSPLPLPKERHMKDMNIIQFLARKGATVSMSESRRLVACGIVRVNDHPEPDMSRVLKVGDVVSIGQRRWVCTDAEVQDSPDKDSEGVPMVSP